jgi:Carboxypeptidase regulatory-like domain/TonB-dependent Receptor Plug Domain/TonB dependent receptor-like, beta-barrel
MRYAATALVVLVVLFSLVPAQRLDAQVTTATFVGLVHDTSGAVVPGATVVATHQGTGVPREAVTDERGEFVLSALPNGSYSIRIELTGFKSHTSQGIALGSGQTVRHTFVLELGTVQESVTVAGEAPLIETASSSTSESFGSQEVRELPVNKRNVTNLLNLVPGVSVGGSGGGMVSMSGVAGGGTGITVDGTEANSNPEGRAVNHYGGQNQISIMSLDSVQEVQVVKGVLPAEYGGVAGGQVNMISRSGTNAFHGTAFYNMQNLKLNARTFLSTTPKPVGTFNQYGGTLGGPIFRNRLFFFTTYEGYRAEEQLELVGNTPNQQTRNALLAALPFLETSIWLDAFPMPTEPIVSTAGVVDPNRGRYRGLGTRERTENHIVAKGDYAVMNGANLAVTYTRMEPWTHIPRFFVNGANDQDVPQEQDRIAAQYVMTAGRWVSESRFGWNLVDMDRWDAFFRVMDPNPGAPAEVAAFGRRVPWGNITNLFSGPDAEIFNLHNHTWSYDQKISRGVDRHLVKMGFRWMRSSGNKLTAQNPQFQYQTLADALANIPTSVNASFGTPYYNAKLDEWGGFFQDDWRLGSGLVLNLGVRYDYYVPIRVRPTTDVPAEAVNLNPPTDLRKMDFGPYTDPLRPYEAASAFAPRLGFAWTVGGSSETVVRGGVGYLYSPHIQATVRQITGEPYVSFRQIWNRTDAAAKGLRFPNYNDPLRLQVIEDGGGRKAIFSVIDTELPSPYTIQSMLSVQRALGRTLAMDVGYIRTNGRDFPLQRMFALARDRETGQLPNPALGSPGGYYVDANQTMDYNALQAALRKRFSNRYSFDVNYTFGKGVATQGGDLAVYSLSNVSNTQEFYDPEFDRGPTVNDLRHRLNALFIYELPELSGQNQLVRAIAGGWQVSGIVSARSGNALTITQPSGLPNSRPDVVPGTDLVIANWQDTCDATGCNYLNPAAFVRVPVVAATNATTRAGNYQVGDARSPAEWDLHSTIAKNFNIGANRRLQIRADFFSILNKKNWGSPVTAINASDFGRITSASGNRSMQVGARFSF